MHRKAVRTAQNELPGLGEADCEAGLRELDRLLRPGDVVIDVGADLGLHALKAARLVGPTGRVLALEPAGAAFGRLTSCLAMSACPWAKALRLAASDRDGEAVRTLTLDSLAARETLRRIDLIRIDVDGAEPKVIAGAARLLRRLRPAVIFESHAGGGTGAASETWDLLAEVGYRFFRLMDGVFSKIADPPTDVCTVLAVHREATPPFER